MALADILQRIENDAAAEEAGIIADAERRAAEIREDARRLASERRDAALEAAKREAEKEAARIVVNARLSARDETVTRRRALIDKVIARAVERVVTAEDGQYARFLARRIAAVARPGESYRLGASDTGRAGAVAEALAEVAPGLNLAFTPDPAPFDHGALVVGDRVGADLSLDAIVDEAREDLELLIAGILFGQEA